MNKLTKAGFAGLFLSLTAVLASCGSSSETSSDTVAVTADVFPVTVGDLTLDAQPTRIISLSPTATEMLYAIGAGDQLIAVDKYSNFPAQANAFEPKIDGYEPSVEAIAALEPTAVLIAFDPGSLQSQLEQLGIAVWVGAAATNFDDSYKQITELGELTGKTAEAETSILAISLPFIVFGVYSFPVYPFSGSSSLDSSGSSSRL